MFDFLTQIADWQTGAEHNVKPLMTPVFAPGPCTGDEKPQKSLLEGERSIKIDQPVAGKEIKRPKQEHLDTKEHIKEYQPKSNTEQYIENKEDLPKPLENRVKEPAFIDAPEHKPKEVKQKKVIDKAEPKVEPITINEQGQSTRKTEFKAEKSAFIETAASKAEPVIIMKEPPAKPFIEPAKKEQKQKTVQQAIQIVELEKHINNNEILKQAPKNNEQGQSTKETEFKAEKSSFIETAESKAEPVIITKEPPAKPFIEPAKKEQKQKAVQQAIQIVEPEKKIRIPEKAADIEPKKTDQKKERQPSILNMQTPAKDQEPRQKKQNKEKTKQTVKVNIGSLTIKDSFKQRHKPKPVYTHSQSNRPQFKPAVTLEQYLRNRG